MVSLLHDLAMVHHNDNIGVPDSGQAVSDDDAGAVLHNLVHGCLNSPLCPGIHIGCSFIQNQDLRIGHECPGNCQQKPSRTILCFSG